MDIQTVKNGKVREPERIDRIAKKRYIKISTNWVTKILNLYFHNHLQKCNKVTFSLETVEGHL